MLQEIQFHREGGEIGQIQAVQVKTEKGESIMRKRVEAEVPRTGQGRPEETVVVEEKRSKVLKTEHPGVYLIGKNYYIDFYFGGKRHRKRVGPDLERAQQERNQRRKRIEDGKYKVIDRAENTTFEQLMKLYKEQGDGKDYILQFESTYNDFFKGMKLSSIGSEDVFKFKDKV